MSDVRQNSGSMSRRNFALAGVATVAAGAGVWYSGALSTHGAAPQVDAAYDAVFASAMTTPAGAPLNLAVLRAKPLVVNFWATWCPPCVEELPLLERFFQQQRAKSWNVLAIAADSEKNVRAFLQRMPLSFAVGVAGANAIELSRSMGNLAGGLPFTLVFASDGKVAVRKLGQVHEPDLASWSAIT